MSNGITKRNENVMFADVHCKTVLEEKAKQICMEYIKSMPHCRNLIFTGIPGTGKTMMASAMINELEKPLTGAIRTLKQIARQFERARDFSVSLSESDVLNSLVSVDLLVIDEFLACNVTDMQISLLGEVVDLRYGEMKPTILISNLSGKGISDSIGGRAVSRLKQECTHIKFDWESKR